MNKKALPALVKLAILTVVTALVWVGFEVYRAFTVSPPLTVSDAVIQPLDPTLDINTLDGIVNKTWLDDSQIGDTVLTGPTPLPSQTQTPSPTVTPQATESASQQVATGSGQI